MQKRGETKTVKVRRPEPGGTKDRVARRLIAWHFKVEPELIEIYRFISPNEEDPNEPIKLLEVSKITFDTGRVDAFAFGPAGDIPYPSIIATVTPAEMERIREGAIPLPAGWNLNNVQVYTPAARR